MKTLLALALALVAICYGLNGIANNALDHANTRHQTIEASIGQ